MRRTLPWIIAVLLLVAATAASAQGKKNKEDQTRSLRGQVLDAGDNPLEKAVVYLKNKGNFQVRTFITPQDGAFHFSGLSPNVDYELHAEHEGVLSATRTLSSFDSRKQVTLNLKIEHKK